MPGLKSTILLIAVNAAAVTMDTGEDGGDFSTGVMVISGMLWVVYICFAMLDQMLSMMFPGDQDEDEQKEAYEQRAEGVENAGRQLAALHKKKGGGD